MFVILARATLQPDFLGRSHPALGRTATWNACSVPSRMEGGTGKFCILMSTHGHPQGAGASENVQGSPIS